MKIKVYTIWKAGSKFTRNYFAELASKKNLNVVKLTASRFQNNPKNIELSAKLPENNYCAILYRFFPEEKTLKDQSIQHIIQLRDPRDVLVSLYYSMAYSHGYGNKEMADKIHKRTQQTPIDKFVLENSDYFYDVYKTLKISTKYKNVTYLKYSDMVLNFPKWNKVSCSVFEADEKTILSKFKNEFLLKKENITKHKRKMIPGDYKEKLEPKTIKILNNKFKKIIQLIEEI